MWGYSWPKTIESVKLQAPNALLRVFRTNRKISANKDLKSCVFWSKSGSRAPKGRLWHALGSIITDVSRVWHYLNNIYIYIYHIHIYMYIYIYVYAHSIPVRWLDPARRINVAWRFTSIHLDHSTQFGERAASFRTRRSCETVTHDAESHARIRACVELIDLTWIVDLN